MCYHVYVVMCVQWYYGIYGGIMCDIYVIYIIFFHSLYVMYLTSPTNYHTCTLPAKKEI